MARWRAARWILAILVLVLLAVTAVPRLTRVAEERIRKEIETRGSRAIGGEVAVSRVEIYFFPLEARVRDLRARKQGNRGSQATVTVDRTVIRAGWLTILGLRADPVTIAVDRPAVQIVLAERRPLVSGESGGSSPLAELPAAAPGSSLRVSDGTIEVGYVDGPRARLTGLRADIRPGPRQGAISGRLEFTGGRLGGLAGDWQGLAGDGVFEASGGGLRFDPVSIRTDGIAMSGRVSAALGGEPAIEGEARGTADIGKLARFFPANAAPQGRVEVRLEGSWGAGGPSVRGELDGIGVTLLGIRMDTLRSDLEIDGKAMRATAIKAHLLGGEATGSCDLSWVSAPWTARADLSVDGVDLAHLLALAGWSGPAMRGTVHYRGRHTLDGGGLPSLRGSGVFDAVGYYPPPRGADLPLELTSRLETEGATIRLTGGTIRAGSVRGNFSGSVSPADGIRLRLSGATGDISEIAPLFTARRRKAPGDEHAKPSPEAPRPPPGTARPAPGAARRRTGATRGARAVRLVAFKPDASEPGGLERIVRALGGRWSWDGDLRYDHGGLSFDGRLAGDDLRYNGAGLGSLEASVRYRDDALTLREATLRPVEGGEIRLQGTVAFGGKGSIAIDATATDCPLAPILRAAGKDLPIDGRVTASLGIGGRPLAPAGRASIESGTIAVAGIRFEGLRGTVLFTPDLLEMDKVVLTQGVGSLTIDGRIPYRGGEEGRAVESGAGPQGVAIAGTDLDLSLWAPAGGTVALAGKANLGGTIGGSLAAPSGHLALDSANALVSGREMGPLTLSVDLLHDTVRVRGEAPDERLSVEGSVGLGEGWPGDLRAVLSGTEIHGRVVLGALEEAKVVVTGRAEVQGPLADRKALRARATLDRLEGSAAGVTVAALGPVEAALEGGRLRLAPVVLEGGGTRVEIGGAVDLAEQGAIDLTARGSFDLRLLRTLLKNLQATGSGEVELRVSGRRDDPSFTGHLAVRADAIRYPDLPFPIGDLETQASFKESGMKIETLRFKAGGGQVEGQGEAILGPDEASRSLFAVRAADLRLGGKDVKCEFPEGFRSASDLDLAFHLDARGATLSGTVDLVKGVYSRDFRIESSMVGANGPDFFALHGPAGPIASVGLDLTIRAAGDVWLRNDFGVLEGQGELKVKGTAARPSVAGRITATEGGAIRFRNVKYRLDRGTLDFADPETINPIFDMQAETSVAEYQVTLKVQGTPDNFKYELSSTPPLPQPDIVALLVTGHTPGTIGSGSRAIGEETVTAYLSGRLSEELSQKVGARAGLDRIAIDPLQLNGQGDPTARVTLGKQVTPDLFVTYSSDLGSTQGAMYQLDYSLGRDLRLTTLRDQDGSLGGDLRYLLRGRPPLLPGSGLDASAAPERPVIAAIHLEGERRLKDAQILRKLRLRPGRRRERGAVNDGVDRLLKLYHDRGYLMAEVDARETPAGPGRVDLTVRAHAGPRIKIGFEGTRTREGYRQNVEPYWEKGIFLDDIVEEARARIVSLFHDRGYQRAEVTAKVARNDDQVFQVLFTIRRGPRVKATEVRVAGAGQIPEAQILKLISSRPEGLFARGLVRDGELRRDAATIRSLYLARGFPQAELPFPEVILDDRGRHAEVVFHVQEGPHVTLRDLRFEGAKGLSADRLLKITALEPGGPYTAEAADSAAVRLKRAYDDAGYPDARIHLRLESVAADEAEEQADLVFGIDEGPRQLVGRVSIDGNVITHERVIRKALAFKPGDPLRRSALLESQRRLYQRGIFSSVAVEPGPLAGPAEATPAPGPAAESASGPAPAGTAPPRTEAAPALPGSAAVERAVGVTVREAAPLSQVFGVGYDSEEKTRVQYGIANSNIFGSGRYVGLDTRASDLQQIASVLYREMGVFGGPYDALASAFWEDQVRPGFSAKTVGSSVQISRQVTRATRTLYSYSLRDVDESKAPALIQATTLRLSSLTASTVHDTRDALFDPMRGHYVSGELQLFGQTIGSEADFAKLYAQAFFFREVLPKTVWAQAVRAGAAYTYGRTRGDPTATGDAVSGLPPSERFFAGGDTTLRGFKRDRVGTLDASGDPLGGEGLFLLNEELRFPIFHYLQGVVFYDAGNIYRTISDYDLTDLRQVAGAGLRIATPIGPFRFEYGAILDRRQSETAGQFFISIGQAF